MESPFLDTYRHGGQRIDMKRRAAILLALSSAIAPAQSDHRERFTVSEFATLVQRCAPNAAVSTMLAIARTESALRPYAVSINRPRKLAKSAGYPNARIDLTRAPESPAEARRWAHWFRAHGFTTSIGIMQVNTEIAQHYGVSDSELFNPCVNVRVASQILGDAYSNANQQYRDPAHALASAISAYNTGNWRSGMSNGYVSQVYRNGRK